MGGSTRSRNPNNRTESSQISRNIPSDSIKGNNERSKESCSQFSSDLKIKSIDETQISILDGSRSSLIDKIGFHYSHEILGQSAGHSLILCILQQKPNSVSDKLSTLSCPSKFRTVLTSSLESRI